MRKRSNSQTKIQKARKVLSLGVVQMELKSDRISLLKSWLKSSVKLKKLFVNSYRNEGVTCSNGLSRIKQAAQIYPELQDPNSDFTKAVATLAYSLSSGQAMKAPDILVWIGHAVRGYQMKLQENGNGAAKVKSPEAKKIVESAKQKIAPTPTRSRSFVERGTRSVSVEKAAKKFAESGDDDSAEEYVGALLSQRGGSKRLEPMGN